MLKRAFWTCGLVAVLSISLGVAVCRGADPSRSGDDDRAARGVAIAGGVATATARSNIDAVVLRRTIQPNILKGNFGEAHMNRFLAKHFAQTSGWSPLQARLGPQGIDGLYLRYDPTGRPTGLIVSEAKYGSSQLRKTADGIQMGKTWRTNRLAAMGDNYRSISSAIRTNTIKLAGPGGSVGRQRLQINLPGSGKAAVFTRASSNHPWEFVGPRRMLPEAGEQAHRIGHYLNQASRGEVAYESAVYRVQIRDGALHVRIKDAALLGAEGNEAKLATRHAFKVPLTERQLATNVTILRSEVAKHLREQFPRLAASDVDAYTKQIVRNTRDLEKVLNNRPPSIAQTIAWNSVKAGGVMAVVDMTSRVVQQVLTDGKVRWREVAVSGGITFASSAAGAAAGQATTALLMRSAVSQQLIARTSTVLGVGSTRLVSQMIGGTVGGGVASVLFAIGGY